MSTTREVIEKVAKLLALAAGKGTTPEEAATAAATAQRLMLQYRIEQAEVEQVTDEDPIESTESATGSDPIFAGDYEGFVYEPKRWQTDLLNAIARTNGCMCVINWRGLERRTKWLNLVGRRGDLEVCRYLWEYLTREIERLRSVQTRGWSQTRKAHFCLGVVHTVICALHKETEAASAVSGTPAALVQRSRYDAAWAWYEAQHPGLRASRPRRTYVDRDAYQDGQAAGAGVSIRKGVTTTTTNPRRLLS